MQKVEGDGRSQRFLSAADPSLRNDRHMRV
jgi:hypothetical protein